MDSRPVIWVFGLVILGFVGGQVGVACGGVASTSCGFQAVYNFGDSNSDTGGVSVALGAVPPPNGITFFGKPSGRVCDGRLIIDFIAENLGLPYLSAYLDSIGTSFRHGANFAVSGSSIRPGGYSPIHLDLQIGQFSQFKSRTTALYNQVGSNGKSTTCTSSIPRPEDFPKALYSFDIGQNDLSFGFQNSPEEQVRASIPDILDQFSKAVQKLYDEGARVFWVHNTGPLGCLPYSVINDQSKPGNLDANGCVKPFNEVAMEFNRQLKYRVSQLKAQLLHSTFTYVDVYSAKYSLISNAKSLGFEDPMQFCCGSYYVLKDHHHLS
ncbi:hypothetical protein Vadar_034781 [Vaccinium darrowii]|uniref:Uncharacterized protein n=1 Tax=Vaccinium darrowii TaxID=229202 RepID=A0ACB7YI84_9ERIC|nr:hypothetical protein Vadar_034781 [Vaccinium darrowii]